MERFEGSAEPVFPGQLLNLVALIQDLVTDGSVMVPIESVREVIDAALKKADKRDRRLTDKALRTLAVGQTSFNVEGDPILDMTVVLGDGLRRSIAS